MKGTLQQADPSACARYLWSSLALGTSSSDMQSRASSQFLARLKHAETHECVLYLRAVLLGDLDENGSVMEVAE